MSKFDKKRARKIKSWKEKVALIPEGCYCYNWDDRVCKHYEVMYPTRVKGSYKGERYVEYIPTRKCRLIGKVEKGQDLLWDQVKICGLKPGKHL